MSVETMVGLGAQGLGAQIEAVHRRLSEARARVYFMEKRVELLNNALSSGDRMAVEAVCREILEGEQDEATTDSDIDR